MRRSGSAWLMALLVSGCGGGASDGDGSGGASETADASGEAEASEAEASEAEASEAEASGDGDGDGDASGDGDGDASGDGDGDASGDGDGDASGDGDGDASGDGDGDATGDGDGDPNDVCNKVDFLFVIDNSISMLPEQTSLTAAFPGFISTIEDTLSTDDHILVADTDLVGWCTPGNCANPNNLHPTCEGPDSYACTTQFSECDWTLGAGVINPAGQAASNMQCDPLGDNRYIVEDEPDKVGVFDCMARVGLAGFPAERPIDAIVQAVSDPLNQPGGCNEGFLRDDAILVVTFISDDDGNAEVNTPQEAFDAIVAAKGGDLDRVVFLGLGPFEDNNCSFTPGAGAHWLELIEMFGDQGLHGPSCADDYVEFFAGAVDVIVQACEANPPT